MFTRFAQPPESWVSHRQIVEDAKCPLLAVVNGTEDVFLNHEFIRNVKYANLWPGKCFELAGFKHAWFWADPTGFATLFEEFARDAERT